ncbi:MAG: serine/threonine-protein kinase [Kofleriaceae bacterium]
MDCEGVTFLLAAGAEGQTAPESELHDHLAGCEACRQLVATEKQNLRWVVGIPEDAVGDRDLLALPVVDPIMFETGAELARGGMGRIIKAHDRRLARDVAIKEVLDGRQSARFEREVAITAQLQHPAIVPIYEAGRWPDGSAYYAMRLVSGGTLHQAIAATKTLEDRLALLPHMIALTDALAYAHSKRIVHRDLKPGNVLVGPFGETIVIDWGLAKELGKNIDDAHVHGRRIEPASNLTMVGAVMGTVGFMSPEQALGDDVDERTDVYALGAILYNLLAGKAPYWDGEQTITPDLIEKRERSGPPTPLGDIAPLVPVDLQAIVKRAMERDRALRFPTAKDMAEELRRFTAGQLLVSRAYTMRELAVRWLKKHRAIVSVAGVALVAVIALGIASIHATVERRREAELALAKSQLEQGRQLVVAGDPHALPLLEAARTRLDDPVTRRLITIASRDAKRLVATFPGTVAALGTTLAIGHADGAIALYDPSTGAAKGSLTGLPNMTELAWHGDKLLCVAPTGAVIIESNTKLVVSDQPITAAVWAGDHVVFSSTTHLFLVSGVAPLEGITSIDALDDRILAVTPTRSIVYQAGQRSVTLPGATYGKLDRDGTVVLADSDALARFAADGTRTLIRHGESQPLVRFPDGTLASGTEIVGGAELPPAVQSQLIAQLDATHVITSGFDREIRIAKLGLPRPVAILDAGDAVDDLLVSGTRAVSIGHGGHVALWDVSNLREPQPVAELHHPIERLVSNGKAIAAWVHADQFHTIIGNRDLPGWPVGFRGDEPCMNDGGKLYLGNEVIRDAAPIQAAAFSGDMLATAAAGVITIRVGANVLRTFDTHRTDITALAIDETHVAIGHEDGSIELWTDGTKRSLDGHSAHVESLTIRGHRLFGASWDRSTRAWDLTTGTAQTLMPSEAHSLSVSPSGALLATVDDSQLVSIWDAAEGRLLEQLPATSSLDSVAFVDDDHVVVGGTTGLLETLAI